MVGGFAISLMVYGAVALLFLALGAPDSLALALGYVAGLAYICFRIARWWSRRRDDSGLRPAPTPAPRASLVGERLQAPQTPALPGGQTAARKPSPADEITKLADLFQRGLITQEEFEAGKRRAL